MCASIEVHSRHQNFLMRHQCTVCQDEIGSSTKLKWDKKAINKMIQKQKGRKPIYRRTQLSK